MAVSRGKPAYRPKRTSRDRDSHIGTLRNVWRLLRLDVGRADDLAPLVDVLGNEIAEVGGRTRKGYRSKFGKPVLDLGVGDHRIYFTMKLFEDSSLRVPGCDDAVPAIRLVAGHEVANSRDVRQGVLTLCTSYGQCAQTACLDISDSGRYRTK